VNLTLIAKSQLSGLFCCYQDINPQHSVPIQQWSIQQWCVFLPIF